MDRLAVEESDTVLLWQAAVDFLACLRRWESRGRISRSQLTSYWQQVESMLPIIPPTAKVIDLALGLHSRHGFPDGLPNLGDIVFRSARLDDQMHLIRHEHVGPQAELVLLASCIDRLRQPLASTFGLQERKAVKAAK